MPLGIPSYCEDFSEALMQLYTWNILRRYTHLPVSASGTILRLLKRSAYWAISARMGKDAGHTTPEGRPFRPQHPDCDDVTFVETWAYRCPRY
jgi:hypothetical protein